MELYFGRPEDVEGRLPREIRTYDFLDEVGIEYRRTDHEPADNMEACNEIDAVLEVVICKNLFLCNRQKTKFYLLMMPGDKKFKTKELSKQINSSRLSFAGPEEMLKYLDIEPGAVSIMGLMNDAGPMIPVIMPMVTENTGSARSCVRNRLIPSGRWRQIRPAANPRMRAQRIGDFTASSRCRIPEE